MPIEAASLNINFAHLAPELALGTAAIIVIMMDLVVRDKRVLAWTSGLGIIVAAVAVLLLWRSGASGSSFSDIVVMDTFGFFFKLLVLGAAFLVVLASPDYVQRLRHFQGEYYGLLLLATNPDIHVAFVADNVGAIGALRGLSDYRDRAIPLLLDGQGAGSGSALRHPEALQENGVFLLAPLEFLPCRRDNHLLL